jgi:hypothetical protein
MRRGSAGGTGFNGAIVPPNKLFNNAVYKKGAWVLHMLRHVLGDDDFFQSLRDYAQLSSAQFSNVTTADFVDSVEHTTGQELSWFFDQWLYRPLRPTVGFDWTVQPWRDKYKLQITVQQQQPEDPWVFPLDVRIHTDGLNQNDVVWISSHDQTFTWYLDDAVTDVEFDPGRWLLYFQGETPTAVDDGVAPMPVQLLANAPNPFNPRTDLRFTLGRDETVRLKIFDPRGRLVRVLEPGHLSAGAHRIGFEAFDERGAPLASGVYQVILEAGTAHRSQSITLVK